MRFRNFIIAAFVFASLHGNAQLPDSVKAHIDSSLLILKEHSLYTKRVNWKKMEEAVYDSARTAQTKAQTFNALKIAFDALGDKHAAYYQYDDGYKIENPALMARYSDSIKAAWKRGPVITNKMIGDMAYISIPYLGGSKQEDIDRYANWIYDAVVKLEENQPKAWIIDLRLNGGGNIRPMLGGLSLFFENGIVSYYIDNKGKATDEAAFINGDFTIDGQKQATIKNKTGKRITSKVAVLIGAGTASSGEGVAVVFKQRKNTKLFGDRSAGLANSTQGFVFNNNQSYFLLSTSLLGDKKKKALPEFIRPAVVVKGTESFSEPAQDAVVIAAMKWLQK